MTNVFVSVVGQEDNLGDSVLRRGWLDALRATGALLHMHTGDRGAGYLSAVGLRPEDTVYPDAGGWLAAGRRAALRGRTVLAFNAGEVRVEPGRGHPGGRQLLILAFARLRGGGGVQTGIGIRTPRYRGSLALRLALRACRVVTWRDAVSRDAIGIGEVEPDWGFATGPAEAADLPRPTLVVSLRGDRPEPSDELCAAILELATRRDLSPVVLSQVQRDSEPGQQLAQRLGAAFVGWASDDHATHERLARSTYAAASVIVTDRLHAAIIALTEGAVVVTPTPDAKLDRTLAAAGFPPLDLSDADDTRIDSAIAARGEQVRATRARLDTLSARVAAAL